MNEAELNNNVGALVDRIGKENSHLLLQVMTTFWGLRDLLLSYCEYAGALSDAITDVLNRRLLLKEPYRQSGYFASVLYMADKETETCSMDFFSKGDGEFFLYFAVGKDENNESIEIGIEEGTSVEFIRLLLETLLVAHLNLHEQLSAVAEGYGKIVLEPRKPN